MKPTLLLLAFLTSLFFSNDLIAQVDSCQGVSFNSPGEPSNCTYRYTSSGWQDANGNSISEPRSIGTGESVCFYANNSDAKFNSVKGTLYIAQNVTFSGDPGTVSNTGVIVVAGTSSMRFPSYNGAKIYIEPTGIYNETLNYSPGGSTVMYNAGYVNVPQNLNIGGSAVVYNFIDAVFSVKSTSYSKISNTFLNCGLLEFPNGHLDTTGSTNLQNYCSTHIAGNFNTNSTFYNYGLIITEGTWTTSGADLYNEGTLMLNYLNLGNNHLIGNDEDSILIIETTSALTSGASITGHMYFDADNGGGIDSVCGSCTADIEILFDIDMPTVIDDIIANCGEAVVPDTPYDQATLDFDGVDDYLTTDAFIAGEGEVTIMAWVKSDNGNNRNMTIAGEDISCKIMLNNGDEPTFTIRNSAGLTRTLSSSPIKLNEWHNVAGSFSKTTGLMKLYVDGELVRSVLTGMIGLNLANSSSSNGKFEVGRTSRNITNQEYFKGDIDEVRVFDTQLTDDQLQQIVYQEIVNNSGQLRGAVIEKDIKDRSSEKKVSWSSLLAYYPMTDIISYERTTDFSNYGRITKLKNITTFQDQTAPMPYETKSNGNWVAANTWLHGTVWDIEDTANNKDWSIIKINHDVTTSASTTSLGLYVAENITLTVNGDNKVENSWYLELNGTIDLKNDSQLVQGKYSDLVTSAGGRIRREQEGNSSQYWYNYWSSPVGIQGTSTLLDNNASSNNPNNGMFSLNMLRKSDNSLVQFTSARDGNGKVSTRWAHNFKNGVTYYDWSPLQTNTAMEPGVGYIHKGMSSGTGSQAYKFQGKPNNGTILLNVSDTGGIGSIPNVSQTLYLVGNPYASAISIDKFIDDNIGVISGSVMLWQQWSGNSHILSEYDGGYAQVNKTGSIRAYQFKGIEGIVTSAQDGTLTPTAYLPVGQGFMVEIVSSGNIEFNNSQRVFIKENDADGSFNKGSVFFKTSNGNRIMETEESPMQKIRIEFNSVDGPEVRRELLLGFSERTTDNYDYGYEAKNTSVAADDINLILDEDKMLIQAYAPITNNKEVPLAFKASGSYTYTIEATAFELLDAETEVYLKDSLTGILFDLRENGEYQFNSEVGEFNDRFTIVFKQNNQTLSIEEDVIDNTRIFYKAKSKKLYVTGLKTDASNLVIVNMLGQVAKHLTNVSENSMESGIELNSLSTGVYIVSINTPDSKKLDTKFIVD